MCVEMNGLEISLLHVSKIVFLKSQEAANFGFLYLQFHLESGNLEISVCVITHIHVFKLIARVRRRFMNLKSGK